MGCKSCGLGPSPIKKSTAVVNKNIESNSKPPIRPNINSTKGISLPTRSPSRTFKNFGE